MLDWIWGIVGLFFSCANLGGGYCSNRVSFSFADISFQLVFVGWGHLEFLFAFHKKIMKEHDTMAQHTSVVPTRQKGFLHIRSRME